LTTPLFKRRARPAGFTLIEAMIAVAIFGITMTLAMTYPMTPILESTDVLLRERARQWLEYEADVVVHRAKADAPTRAALQALVPAGQLVITPSKNGAHIVVQYRRTDGRTGEVFVDLADGRLP